ncbi:MAG: hypothetical protein U9O56_00665, partial [Campylobacterota bacterium]|nr:hypothetical protein [Campylobacterota bacterium]
MVFSINTFACSLCSMDIPIVNTYTKIYAKKTYTHFDIRWEFSKKFVDSLSMYDQNENNKFDENELEEIRLTLEDYLKTNSFSTEISYEPKHTPYSDAKQIKIINPKTKMSYKNGKIFYNYSFDIYIIMQKDKKLYIKFYDSANNFNFQVADIVLKDYEEYKIIEPNENDINIYFYKDVLPKKIKAAIENNTSLLKTAVKTQHSEENNYFLDSLAKELNSYKIRIKLLLSDIQENNSFLSYFWLLIFSFLYGVLHAIGPGHGKSLVSAYFLSEDKSYIKAFNISLLIGVVHTFSAFLLTMVIYYILNTIFANYFTDIEYIATKVSAIVIIIIALYLIFKKIDIKKKPAAKFTIHNPNTHSCSCSGCKTDSTDIGVILAAGIVPCPGTVTIFIFTFGLGIYFVGFLSAIFMSLGMSLIIFVMAYLSIKIQKKAQKSSKLIKLFEYGSLVFILFLGILLLII